MGRLRAAWFQGDDPSQRGLATIVDDLGRHWRSLLAQALQRTLGGDPDETTAVRRLVQLPASRLPAVDDALRRGSWFRTAAPPPRAPVSASGALDADEAAAYLFVAACNASGFVRQRTLQALRHAPGPLALAAALIRCDDWVPQVRLAAEALLRAAVFDRARSPRSAAAFELPRRFGVVAADAWRVALAEEPGRRRTAALLGLCDAPSPGDVDTLVETAGLRFTVRRPECLRRCGRTWLGFRSAEATRSGGALPR